MGPRFFYSPRIMYPLDSRIGPPGGGGCTVLGRLFFSSLCLPSPFPLKRGRGTLLGRQKLFPPWGEINGCIICEGCFFGGGGYHHRRMVGFLPHPEGGEELERICSPMRVTGRPPGPLCAHPQDGPGGTYCRGPSSSSRTRWSCVTDAHLIPTLLSLLTTNQRQQ